MPSISRHNVLYRGYRRSLADSTMTVWCEAPRGLIPKFAGYLFEQFAITQPIKHFLHRILGLDAGEVSADCVGNLFIISQER